MLFYDCTMLDQQINSFDFSMFPSNYHLTAERRVSEKDDSGDDAKLDGKGDGLVTLKQKMEIHIDDV